jgi:uncharacterized membrane protein
MIQVAGHHSDGNHALMWLIFAVLLVLLLVALISLVLDHYHRSNQPQPVVEGAPPGGALAVLDTRYASGEVTREDYLRTREDLGGPAAATP